MAKHKVIQPFSDQFNGHHYVVGELYPGKFGGATTERLETLTEAGAILEEEDQIADLKAENAELRKQLDLKIEEEEAAAEAKEKAKKEPKKEVKKKK